MNISIKANTEKAIKTIKKVDFQKVDSRARKRKSIGVQFAVDITESENTD